MPTNDVTYSADLLAAQQFYNNTSASIGSITPTFYTNSATTTIAAANTITFQEPYTYEAPKSSKTTARQWLEGRIKETCAVGREALAA